MSEKLKFCPDCWTNLENINGNFCPSCGFKIPENNLENTEKISEKKEEKFEKNENSSKTEKIVPRKILREKVEEKNNNKTFLIIIICLLVTWLWYLFWTWKINFWDKKENNSWNIENSTWKISSWETEKISTWKIEENSSNSWEIEKTEDINTENKDYKNIFENQLTNYNYWNTYFLKVKSDRAFFYDENNNMSPKKSYVMAWDIVTFPMHESYYDVYKDDNYLRKNFTYLYYTANNWKRTEWFLKNIDLIPATKEEVEKEIKRLEEINKKTTSNDKDEEYKNFLISHYNEIKNKNYYTAFHNYQYPKAKNVDDFASWYKWVYEINLSEIQKIWENEYKYIVFIYSDSWLNKIETSIKVWEVDWKIKILGYWTKKVD